MMSELCSPVLRRREAGSNRVPVKGKTRMKRRKSTPADDALVTDETASPGKRAAALTNIGVDQLVQFEPQVAALLNHPEYQLRGKAIRVLVGLWSLDRYLEAALRLLQRDPEWPVRVDAAIALGMFVKFANRDRDRVLRELTVCLMRDEEWAVQKRCYEELMDLLGRSSLDVPNMFERERDVDLTLIAPYRPKSVD